MKNTFILVSLVAIMCSCASAGYKYNREAETPLKGTWICTSVVYSQDNIKVKAFDFADAQCFKGSVWTLVPNNHTGDITEGASNSNCPYIDSDVTWYIDDSNVFNLKVLNGMKAKEVKDGYVFQFTAISDTNFSLTQSANLDGSPVYITYNFIKQ